MKKLLPLALCCALFSCSGCDLFSPPYSETATISVKVLYDELATTIRESMGFYGNNRAIANDGLRLYGVSMGDKKGSGRLIVIEKDGKVIREIDLQQAAAGKGYGASVAFEPETLAILDDSVYVVASDDYIIPQQFELLCFDKARLELKWDWSFPFLEPFPLSDPFLYGGDRLILPASEYDIGLVFFIFDLQGRLLCKRDFAGGADRTNGDILVHEGIAYFRQDYRPIVAFDLAKLVDASVPDAECKVYEEVDSSNLGWSNDTSVVGDDRTYYTISQGKLKARRYVDNATLWSCPIDTAAPIDAPLTLDRGSIFVSSERGDVFRVDAATGRLLWKLSLDSYREPNIDSQSVVVAGRWLAVPVYSNSWLCVIDIATGKVAATMKNFYTWSSNITGFYEDGVYYQTGDTTINVITITEK